MPVYKIEHIQHSVNVIIGIVYSYSYRSPNNSESSDSNLWLVQESIYSFSYLSDITFSKSINSSLVILIFQILTGIHGQHLIGTLVLICF